MVVGAGNGVPAPKPAGLSHEAAAAVPLAALTAWRALVVHASLRGGDRARSWEVLRPGGVLVSAVAPPDPGIAAAHHARGRSFIVEPDRAGPLRTARLIEDGRLTPVVDRVVPHSGTRVAYEALEREHRRGKVVIRV